MTITMTREHFRALASRTASRDMPTPTLMRDARCAATYPAAVSAISPQEYPDAAISAVVPKTCLEDLEASKLLGRRLAALDDLLQFLALLVLGC
jgi:hypothetical protein